jgi:hypothetical protein
MDGWVGGWVDGWMDGYVYKYIHREIDRHQTLMLETNLAFLNLGINFNKCFSVVPKCATFYFILT